MDPLKSGFKVLDHTADLRIKVRGKDMKGLFEQAALAMMQVMISSKPGGEVNRMKLSLDAEDPAELMVLWLGEILYLFEGEKKVVIGLEIESISPADLNATLETVSFDPNCHEVVCEIKAVTYHQIEVVDKGNCWEAKIIFDL